MNHTLHREWDQAAGELNTIPLVDERVRYAAAIKPLLAIPKTSCILEVGCGSGRLLRALAALGYQDIVGLEISPSRLRQVTRFGPSDARLICSNVVPFVSEQTLYHFAPRRNVAKPSIWHVPNKIRATSISAIADGHVTSMSTRCRYVAILTNQSGRFQARHCVFNLAGHSNLPPLASTPDLVITPVDF